MPPPTVSWRTGSKPRDTTKADGTLAACEDAAKDPEFSGFVTMEIW
jgi:hypothetical protein